MCWNCLHIHSPSNSDTHYLRIIFGHWEFTKTLDETCNIIFAYRIFRCNVANSSTIIYCVQCTHGVCLLLGFLTHKSKMCCCRNKSAAKTTNINTARINFYPEEVKKREKWNVKKCAHRCGFKRFHSLMPQVLFVSFWLTDLVRSLPLCSSIFLKKKRLTVLSLCLLLLRGHDRHIQHYILITASFMNWWQICLSNMYGRCSMCLHIRNVLYIEFQVDDDGNGDIFTAITLSIIESI